MTPYAVVLGGANMDLSGISEAPIINGDSNPGRVRFSPGGVGRNIAQALAGLGVQTQLITALGNDAYGKTLKLACQNQKIGMEHTLMFPNAQTACYLSVSDCNGDLIAAVADMEICRRLTPRVLEPLLPVISGAAIVVLDANLPQETLDYLCRRLTVPIFCDPVSTSKAGRLKRLLPFIHTLKPNRMEATLLSGVPITDDISLERAAGMLVVQGVQNVFLSMAQNGIYCRSRTVSSYVPAWPTTVVSDTGGGDSAMAALVWAHLHGLPMAQAAALAAKAASLTLASPEAVSPDLGKLVKQ